MRERCGDGRVAFLVRVRAVARRDFARPLRRRGGDMEHREVGHAHPGAHRGEAVRRCGRPRVGPRFADQGPRSRRLDRSGSRFAIAADDDRDTVGGEAADLERDDRLGPELHVRGRVGQDGTHLGL